jgi:hypothetical protein
MNALVLLLAVAATAAKPAPVPTSPVGWILGAKPAAGAWATYETHAEMVTFAGGADGADVREAKLTQRTRVTFLYLGATTTDGVRGEWLELQEQLLELTGPGIPEGMASAKGVMVTRVLLSADGKILRTVTQQPGRPAEETAVVEGMSVAVGALAPFDALHGELKRGDETVEAGKLGRVPAVRHEATGARPPRTTRIWRRTSDGLCLEIVDSTEGVGTNTYRLTGAGRGGTTRIEGPIEQRAPPGAEQAN